MSKDLYQCTNTACSLFAKHEEYEYIFGQPRPICKECSEDPSLVPTPQEYHIRSKDTGRSKLWS